MPSPSIPLAKAYLAAIWLETFFYGVNACMFGFCILTLTVMRRTPRVNKLLVGIAVAMFVLSTAHVSLGFARLIQGFIVDPDRPGGPGAYFSDVSVPINVVKTLVHTINSVIGDTIVVWRCYIVWGKSWQICVLPVLLLTASAASGIAQGIAFARAKTAHSAFAPEIARWLGTVFSLSLTTNLLVSSLIAVRLWYLFRRSKYLEPLSNEPKGTFWYWRPLLVMIESGMVYSAVLIFEIAFYLVGSNAFYIVYDPIGQIMGIVPTTILVLAGLGLTSGDIRERERSATELSKIVFRRPAATINTHTLSNTSISTQEDMHDEPRTKHKRCVQELV